MEDGDLYPNDGQQIGQLPDDRQKAEDEEQTRVFASLPVLDDLIEHTKERVAFYRTIDSIPSDDKTTPTELLRLVTARKLTVEYLEDELNLLENFRRQYT